MYYIKEESEVIKMSDIGNKEIFAQNLSYYIERSGKTQKEIAEVLNVATSTLNNWVTGKKYPRMDKVEMLANFFGILKSDLIEEQTKKPVKDDELSESQRILIDFAKGLTEDQAAKMLRLMKSILAFDE